MTGATAEIFYGREPSGISYVFRVRGFRPARKSLSVASEFPEVV